MAIYLKVDGLEGSVTAEGHEGWTECHSLQLNVSRVITTSTGSSQERESSAPSVSEVTVTKVMDKSTPALFTEACVGRSKLVKIDLVQTGEQLVTYMSYELENSLISGYAVRDPKSGASASSATFACTGRAQRRSSRRAGDTADP